MKWNPNIYVIICPDGILRTDRSHFPNVGGIFATTVTKAPFLKTDFKLVDVASAWFYVENYETTKEMIIPYHLYPIFEFFGSDSFTEWSRYTPIYSSQNNEQAILDWLDEPHSELNPSLEAKIRQNYISIIRPVMRKVAKKCEHTLSGFRCLLKDEICNTKSLKLSAMIGYAQQLDKNFDDEPEEFFNFLEEHDMLSLMMDPEVDVLKRDDIYYVRKFIRKWDLVRIAIMNKVPYLVGKLKNANFDVSVHLFDTVTFTGLLMINDKEFDLDPMEMTLAEWVSICDYAKTL